MTFLRRWWRWLAAAIAGLAVVACILSRRRVGNLNRLLTALQDARQRAATDRARARLEHDAAQVRLRAERERRLAEVAERERERRVELEAEDGLDYHRAEADRLLGRDRK
jgi:hypothetical protein